MRAREKISKSERWKLKEKERHAGRIRNDLCGFVDDMRQNERRDEGEELSKTED